MALTNLKTVLTKTAKVASVTLAAPADRIGSGAAAVTMPRPGKTVWSRSGLSSP